MDRHELLVRSKADREGREAADDQLLHVRRVFQCVVEWRTRCRSASTYRPRAAKSTPITTPTPCVSEWD